MDEIQNQSVGQETEPLVTPQPNLAPTPSVPVPMPPPAPPVPVAPTVSTPSNQIPLPPSGSSQNTGLAILAYLGILIIVPFFTDAKNDQFVKFHIKQGLALIILWIGAGILSLIFSYMLYTIGTSTFLPSFLFSIIYLCLITMNIIGIVNAANGQMKELPLIGHLASSFNF